MRELVQELGREPSAEETAERAKLSIEDTRIIMKMARQPLSLDQSVGDHDDSYLANSSRTIATMIRCTKQTSRH